MDGKRAPAAEPDDAGERARAGEGTVPAAGAPAERFGPLSLSRLRKDDGRALLVFARAERGEP
jgi:hypothetical protein